MDYDYLDHVHAHFSVNQSQTFSVSSYNAVLQRNF